MIDLIPRLKRSIYLIIFGSFVFIQFFCSKRVIEEPTEKTLVSIGSRTISVDEFIRRAEYTIRPTYCKGDYYIHKKSS